DLGDLDHAARRGHLDAAPGLGRLDLVGEHARARVDDDLHSVALHRPSLLPGHNRFGGAGPQPAESIHKVTGPSLTSSTSMCSRKAPRRTLAPRDSSAFANASTRSSAISGGAAPSHDGRRPLRTSPYSVNCGTTRISPPTSASERFILL